MAKSVHDKGEASRKMERPHKTKTDTKKLSSDNPTENLADEQYEEDLKLSPKVPQQPCIRCHKEYNIGEVTCPHCGYTKWGSLVLTILVGLILVPLAIYFIIGSIDEEGVVMEKLEFFLSIIGGIIGLVMLVAGVISLSHAIRIRRDLKGD